MKVTDKIQFRLPSEEHRAFKILALRQRKDFPTIVEEVVLDILEGRLVIEDEKEFQQTSTSIEAGLIPRLEQFAKDHGVPKNRLIRQAIKAKLLQETDK